MAGRIRPAIRRLPTPDLMYTIASPWQWHELPRQLLTTKHLFINVQILIK